MARHMASQPTPDEHDEATNDAERTHVRATAAHVRPEGDGDDTARKPYRPRRMRNPEAMRESAPESEQEPVERVMPPAEPQVQAPLPVTGSVDDEPRPVADEAEEPETGEPAKKDKVPVPSKNLVSNILIVVGVALLVVAAVIFFNNQRNYQKIDEENERVAEYARLTDDSEQPPQVDWASLKSINPDVVGWIQVPGTVVNYPVFQTGDNEYYLTHAPDKSESIGGAVFMDYENKAPGLVDAQTIVYGHHMRNGSQFKQIADMENQELFDGVSTVWYVTEDSSYKLAPLFLYYTSEDDLEVRQFEFADAAALHTYLKKYLGEARAKRADVDQAIDSVRHVFTLSTCNYEDGYGRSLLVCAPKSEIPGMPEYDAEAAKKAAKEEQEKKEKERQEQERIRQEQEAQAQALRDAEAANAAADEAESGEEGAEHTDEGGTEYSDDEVVEVR